MIHRESWYREATERSQRELEKAAEGGDLGALYQLGREYLRTKKIPKLPPATWITFMPTLEKVSQDSEEGEWAWVFLWAAAKATETMPDVDSAKDLWMVPEEAMPRIKYERSWSVQTDGSTREGDNQDYGMETSEGDRISFMNIGEGEPPWKLHDFTQETSLDDFLDMLRNEGYIIEGGDYWTKWVEIQEAQGEFGETYGEDLGPPSDYDGTPYNEVIGGRFDIHLKNFQEYQDRIDGWVKR